MKNIWIVNYYSYPPEYSSNHRHIEFTKNLLDEGYDVTIIGAGFIYNKGIELVQCNRKYIIVNYGKIKYIHIKVRHYTGNEINRMLSISQFAWNLFKYRNRFKKPDVILHNIHAPFDYPIVWCAKKLRAKYIVEAWDLWPDSFARFGIINKSNPLMKMAYKIEKIMYERADKIIFSMEGGVDYLNMKKWTKEKGGNIDTRNIYYINNGVNLKKFDYDRNRFKIHDHDLEDDQAFKVVYMGTVSMVNNIMKLVEAAKCLKSYSNIKILIYGDGSERESLKRYCEENEIRNVIFKEKWIPLKYVPYVISQSSLNILNYQRGFGLYGISSGKLFQYLAAGKPIVANIKMNYCLISKYNLGIAKEFDTPKEYSVAITTIASMDQSLYVEICDRVRNIAKEFDYEVLSKKLIKILL